VNLHKQVLEQSFLDQDEQGLISNESAFTNYESIKNPYEQMEADRAHAKSNPAFENGEVEMQDLTPTGSDKGEPEREPEATHVSIPPLIQSNNYKFNNLVKFIK